MPMQPAHPAGAAAVRDDDVDKLDRRIGAAWANYLSMKSDYRLGRYEALQDFRIVLLGQWLDCGAGSIRQLASPTTPDESTADLDATCSDDYKP